MSWQNDLQSKGNSRPVTEDDLRLPEFRGVKLEQLEIREDGKVVRKDRFETSMHIIAGMTTGTRGGWECEAVVEAVRKLIGPGWNHFSVGDFQRDEYPPEGAVVEVELEDGSVLRNVTYQTVSPAMGGSVPTWRWGGDHTPVEVIAWREQALDQEQEA